MSDDWLQLSLTAGPETAPEAKSGPGSAPGPGNHSLEQIEDAMLAAGAVAVTLSDAADNPVLEPAPGETPLWPHTRITGLFDIRTDVGVVKHKLIAALGPAAVATCEQENLPDRDWVRAWLDDFKPMRFGRRLWVCPSHHSPPDPAAVNLMLDPGLAFGTGTHATTALCLEWLDGANLDGRSVLDYGCGSGILGIAAAKLGAVQVTAIDIDPQAIQASRDNAERNGVRIHTGLVDALAAPTAHRFDTVVANILAGPLIELAPALAALTQSKGELALSGILAEQAAAVRSAYEVCFELAPDRERDGWILVSGRRR